MKHFHFIITTSFFIIPVFLFAQVETIIIDNHVFKSKSRSAVKFTHGSHMMLDGVSCSDCHHRFENGKNMIDSNELSDDNRAIYCRYCHAEPEKLKNSYHRLCIRCHNSMIKKNKAAGPRLCGECHR